MKELLEMTMSYFNQEIIGSDIDQKLKKLETLTAGLAYSYFITNKIKHDQYIELKELLELYTEDETYSTAVEMKKAKKVIEYMIRKELV
jgi:hypothetical protein